MKVEEIYRTFIKLNSTQKARILVKLDEEGVSEDVIDALSWLAVLSNDKMKDQILTELYAAEAFKEIKRTLDNA